MKALSEAAPLGQIVFFRSFFALIPLMIFLAWRHEFPSGLHTRRPLGHLVRSFFGAAAMFTSFASVALLPLAEAVRVIVKSGVQAIIMRRLAAGLLA